MSDVVGTLVLDPLPGLYAICRLDPLDAIPDWATGPGFSTISRSADELSIVIAADRVPADVVAVSPMSGWVVRGTLDFALVGILASLTTVLAEAGVSVFAISTYDTDYLLVPTEARGRAADALSTVVTVNTA